MVAVETRFPRDFVVVGEQEAAVADGVEVLERMRRNRAAVAEGAAVPAVAVGAHRLRRILDDLEVVAGGDVADRFHIGDAADPLHRHDRLGARGDLLLHFRRVDGLVGQHVGVDRRRTEVDDRTGGGDERHRRRDHLVARADTHRPHADDQRIGARVQRDAVLRAGVLAHLLLEFGNLFGHHQVALGEHPVDAGENFLPLFLVAVLQIDERNLDLGHFRHFPE